MGWSFERSEGDNPAHTYYVLASVPGLIIFGLDKDSAIYYLHFMRKLWVGEWKGLTEGRTLSK